MSVRSTRAIAAVVIACMMHATPRARAADAPTAAQCISVAEKGQTERDEGRLLESKASFAKCGAEACPPVVRRECLGWLSDVEARIPTVVVSARDTAGKDVAGARIMLDGQPLPSASVGRAMPVNPGQHQLKAQRQGYRDADLSVIVREGEKGRPLVLELASSSSPVDTRPVKISRPVPALSWILGGVAVLGGAGFGVFWGSTMQKVSDMRASCAPFCSSDRIDDARTDATIARVSLGVGVAAALGAIVVFLATPGVMERSGSAPAQRAAMPAGLSF